MFYLGWLARPKVPMTVTTMLLILVGKQIQPIQLKFPKEFKFLRTKKHAQCALLHFLVSRLKNLLSASRVNVTVT